MIEYRAFMAAWDHHQRAALVCTVFDENTHSENVIVGVRIKCPVLVPVDLGIRPGVLEVQFRVIEPNRTTQQFAHGVNNRPAFCELLE